MATKHVVFQGQIHELLVVVLPVADVINPTALELHHILRQCPYNWFPFIAGLNLNAIPVLSLMRNLTWPSSSFRFEVRAFAGVSVRLSYISRSYKRPDTL